MFTVQFESNPRRQSLSFLIGLVLNFCLLGVMLTFKFAVPDLLSGPDTGRSILIAPARPLLAAQTRHLAPVRPPAPAARIESPVKLDPSPAPQLVSTTPPVVVVTPHIVVAPPPLPAAIVTGGFQAATFPAKIPRRAAPELPVGSFAATTGASTSGAARLAFVAAGEFGSASTIARPGTATGGVQAVGSGFDSFKVASPRPHDAPVTPSGSFRSVEILNKPKPDYTEEARRKRVEGEVWLEVLFGADGTSTVRHVLRSLGYGLDENAIRAARQIRFRPAREGSREVDQVATVRVQFQLAE